ncbi:MAG: hypothetical protein ACE5GH_01035 [Fidelibacterota bacterium]
MSRPSAKLGRIKSRLLFLAVVLISGVVTTGAVRDRASPRLREITFEAKKYAYRPHRIHVNLGDTLRIRLVSRDVTHGFFLEGFGIDAYVRAQYPYFYVRTTGGGEEEEGEYDVVESYTLIASKTGKFHYRCSITCGPMHPFMQGEMIVGPNYPYRAAMGLTVGVMIASLLGFSRQRIKVADETGHNNRDPAGESEHV